MNGLHILDWIVFLVLAAILFNTMSVWGYIGTLTLVILYGCIEKQIGKDTRE